MNLKKIIFLTLAILIFIPQASQSAIWNKKEEYLR